MLIPYRRHVADCPHRSDGRRWIRCKCPIWTQGRLDNGGEIVREALGTRVWTEANEIIQKWNADGRREQEKAAPLPGPAIDKGVTIAEACEAFTAEMHGQQLRDSSQKKYRTMFRQLKAFCAAAGITEVSELSLQHTEQFRQTWSECTSGSAGKRLERLRTFMGYLAMHGWIVQNYAKLLKRPRDTARPTMPYTVDEMKRILDACSALIVKRPKFGKLKLQRLRALILLARYSGLRIADCASLACDRLDGQRLFLYTAKTGTPVHTKLPQFVVDELDRCPRLSPGYWFWTGNSTKEILSENYRRVFREVAKLAGVKGAHPHRFRDTFAVELLLNHVPIEQVSMLLGHSSIKVTEKHYLPWVRARQQQLEESLDRAIKNDPLAIREGNNGKKLLRVK
jgi:site-specific recombinase XerD